MKKWTCDGYEWRGDVPWKCKLPPGHKAADGTFLGRPCKGGDLTGRERRYHILGWSAAGLSFVSAGLGYWSGTARLVTLGVSATLFVTALVVRGGP